MGHEKIGLPTAWALRIPGNGGTQVGNGVQECLRAQLQDHVAMVPQKKGPKVPDNACGLVC